MLYQLSYSPVLRTYCMILSLFLKFSESDFSTNFGRFSEDHYLAPDFSTEIQIFFCDFEL